MNDWQKKADVFRGFLLWIELAGWLHDIGKLSSDYITHRANWHRFGDDYVDPHTDNEGEGMKLPSQEPWDHSLKIILEGFPDCSSRKLSELFQKIEKKKCFFGMDKCDLSSLIDRKSTRLNSSHIPLSRMPSSA